MTEKDGTTVITNAHTKIPDTGDTANAAGLVGACLASLAVLVVLPFSGRRKEER